jgi:hypothetical protein
MFVKSITVYVLPAAPWASPSFTPRERVGHGGGPAGAWEAGGTAAEVAGAADVGAELAGALEVTVTVATGAGPPELQPEASTAMQVRVPPATARRAIRSDEVIRGILVPRVTLRAA